MNIHSVLVDVVDKTRRRDEAVLVLAVLVPAVAVLVDDTRATYQTALERLRDQLAGAQLTYE